MKYNVGDLFVSCNKVSVRYIDSIVKAPQESTPCTYNMTHVDDVLECIYPCVTEVVIDLWIHSGSWKHYPVKKENI
jgi:hypothetical protein